MQTYKAGICSTGSVSDLGVTQICILGRVGVGKYIIRGRYDAMAIAKKNGIAICPICGNAMMLINPMTDRYCEIWKCQQRVCQYEERVYKY